MRIAHITDLHLRHHLPGTASLNARRSRQMATLFAEALRQARQQGADLVALTGDLLDVPSWLTSPVPGFLMDEPDTWRAAAASDYQLLREMLDECGLPYLVLPGNHDDPSLMGRVFDLRSDTRDVAGHRIARFCDYEHEGHVPRRYVPSRDLFDALMADDSGLPQVHLQHYVITPELNEGYPHTYGESAWLRRQIAASGRVRLCLSGHYHAGTDLIQESGTWFATTPAFCVWPFRWRMYDIAGDTVTMQPMQQEQSPPSRPVVFLDRDGVINDLPSYRAGVERMRLLPGSGEAVARMQQAGLAQVVITSQSCIGYGIVPEAIVQATHDRMHRLLAEYGGAVDAVYYSQGGGEQAVLPRYVDESDAKPRPTLLLRAAEQLHLDLGHACMVGDRLTDVQTAVNAGITPILVRTGYGARHEAAVRQQHGEAIVVDDLAAAVETILRVTRSPA
jgi:histidinol-phosphate phosphatase family protein